MRFLWAFASLLHFAIGINFPGLRIPNSGPLKSAFTAEPCTDVLQSGDILERVHQWSNTNSRSHESKPSDTAIGRGPSVYVTWLRRHLFLLTRVQVPLDLCPSPWNSLEIHLLQIQRHPHGPCWRKVQGWVTNMQETKLIWLFQVTFCGFMTWQWETALMTPESATVTLPRPTSHTTLRSRFSSEATWTLW